MCQNIVRDANMRDRRVGAQQWEQFDLCCLWEASRLFKKMSHMASNNGIKRPEAMAPGQKGSGQRDQSYRFGAILK